MSFLFDFLFGCWHKNFSFPQSCSKGPTGHYVVCLDCGKEWDYDWAGMKVLGERVVEPETKQAMNAEVELWPGHRAWAADAVNRYRAMKAVQN